MTLVSDLKDCQCIVDTAMGRFLCFSRVARDTLILCASDGLDLWKIDLDPTELETHRELADVQMEQYLNKLKVGIQTGNLTITQSGVKCTLTIGYGTKSLVFDLHEARVADKKTEIKTILFALAARTSDLEAQLSKANKTIDSLKQQKASSNQSAGMFDLGDAKKGKATQPKATTKAHMSVVNPGSRKRKTAKGIDFD